MDSANLLRQQQLDFYSRLEKNKLSLNEQNYDFKELVMVGQNTIEEITLESIQIAEDIIRQYEFNYPRKQILNTIFLPSITRKWFLIPLWIFIIFRNFKPRKYKFLLSRGNSAQFFC